MNTITLFVKTIIQPQKSSVITLIYQQKSTVSKGYYDQSSYQIWKLSDQRLQRRCIHKV